MRAWMAVAGIGFVGCLGCWTDPAPPAPAGPAPSASAAAESPSSSASAAAEAPSSSATATAAAGGPSPGGVALRLCTWSRAGDRLALATEELDDGKPVFFDMAIPGGEVRATRPRDQTGELFGLYYSPGGSLLVAWGNHVVEAYRMSDLSEAYWLEHIALDGGFAFSPDDTRLVWIDVDGFAGIEDLRTKKTVQQMRPPEPRGSYDGTAFWLSSGDRVAIDPPLELWGLKGKRITPLRGTGSSWAPYRAWPGPRNTVITAGGDGAVRVWDGATGQANEVIPAFIDTKKDGSQPIDAAELSEDGETLVMHDPAGPLVVADLSAKKRSIVPFPKGRLENLSLSPDGSRAGMTVSLGGNGGTWAKVVRFGATPATQDVLRDGFVVGFAADGAVIASGAAPEPEGAAPEEDTRTSIVAWADGKERWRVSGLPSESRVALSPGGKVVAIAAGDLRLIRVSDGRTATFTVEKKGEPLRLAPAPGTSPEDIAAVLGAVAPSKAPK